MSYQNSLIKKLNLSKLAAQHKAQNEQGGEILDMMLDSRYLRQSSSLINEALQKGFDVLQLSDGDIVTTGTKTIVHRYQWDAETGKLARVKTEQSGVKRMRRAQGSDEMILDEDTDEDA